MSQVSINTIIAQIKLEMGVSDSRRDIAIRQQVMNSISEINIYISTTPFVKRVKVTDISTAPLPKDFMRYVRIAVRQGDRLCVLNSEYDLAFRTTGESCDCAEPPKAQSDGYQYNHWYQYSDFSHGNFNGQVYGDSSKVDVPSFRINRDSWVIEFDSRLKAEEVVLEYIGSGDVADSDQMISREYLPVIKSYVHWKMSEYDPKVPLSTKVRREEQYIQEAARANELHQHITTIDFVDVLYGAVTSSPK